jgi:predicted acyltransferase
MKLWTTSYGIASAGWACLLFLFFFWLIDACGYRAWSLVFVVVGTNALAAYLAGTLVPFSRIVTPFTNALAPQGGSQVLLQALAILIAHWLVLYWMYKRGIFIKV